MSRSKEPLHEWTDPITGDVHKCPLVYMSITQHVGLGERLALRAAVLLRKIDRPINDRNERHVRKAAFIIRRALHIPLVSTRSARGGYYIAATREELEQHCEIQEKLAASMLAGVQALRDHWNGGRPRPPKPRPPRKPKPPPDDRQPDFFK